MARPEPGLTLVGGGRMGSALAGGWIKSGYEGPIAIHDPAPSDLLKSWADSGKIERNVNCIKSIIVRSDTIFFELLQTLFTQPGMTAAAVLI